MSVFIKVAFLALFSLFLHAKSEKVDNSHFLVEIIADNADQRTEIAKLIHIDQVQGNKVFSIVNKFDFSKVSNNKSIDLVRAELINSDKDPAYSIYNPYSDEIEFPFGDEAFHTYKEVVDELNRYATQYADIAEVFSVGKTHENRDIWGIKLGKKSSAKKPAIAFMGTHHAREHVSTEIPLLFIKKILESSASDLEIKKFLEEIDIYVIPVVNPDGAIHDIKGRSYKWWRKNRKNNGGGSYGVDLNRNYGYQWGTGGSSNNKNSDVYMGPAPFSEPETVAIKNFFTAHENITIALSFHTFSELILYPWSYSKSELTGKDKELFKKMAEDMAAMNHYTPMQSSELYVASGETCDYLYGEHSIYCFTFELSPASMYEGGFYPGASVIQNVFNDNYGPMLYLLRLTKNPFGALKG